MTKYPTEMPDAVARKLVDLAREYGYGIENLILNWRTKDLGQPSMARAIYAPEIVESCSVDGDIRRTRL